MDHNKYTVVNWDKNTTLQRGSWLFHKWFACLLCRVFPKHWDGPIYGL